MGNTYFVIIFLLINLASISAKANNSLDDCRTIAGKFTSNKTVTCYGSQNTTCPVNISNGICVFQHRVLVTCLNSTPIRIHIQSNGLPSFCPNRNSSYQFHEQNIDFTVNFNPDVLVSQPKHNPTTQTELNTIVCNTSSTKSAPDSAGFMNGNNTSSDRIAGISIDGVPIFNALNYINEDAFYPKTTTSTESVDQCLGRSEKNDTYHYRLGTSCPLDPPDSEITTCDNIPSCHANVTNYSTSMFGSHKSLTIVGIAKDGHIIYGPYTSNGSLITNGFDICNGMFFDSIGNYGYFVTNTFPYIIGCFGPSSYPKDLLPNCTKNPPMFYKKSSYADALSSVNSGSFVDTFNFVFLSTMIIVLINSYFDFILWI